MPLALSISDNQDGTGGVSSITGTGGATVSLYYVPATGQLSVPSFVLAGTRTGDGTLTVNPGAGYYWWFAQTGSTLSNFVYQNLSDDSQSVHYRCLLAVQARIQGLNLQPAPTT